MPNDEFDWDSEDNKCVIFSRVDAVAIYTNRDNNVIIRQRDTIPADIATSPFARDEDSFVIIPRHYLPKVIQRLKDLLSED